MDHKKWYSWYSFQNTAASITALTVATLMINAAIRRRRRTNKPHGGSIPGKAPNRELGREAAASRLNEAYFLDSSMVNAVTSMNGPTFTETEFERRFRMPREIYSRVKAAIVNTDPFFAEGKDCTGKQSCSTDQKMVAAISQLSHGVAAAFLTNELRMSESLIHKSRQRFVSAVCKCFASEYLRLPNVDDLAAIMARHAKIGFPGALGSLDCAGWKLHRGAVAEQRKTIGKSGVPELRLECVADDRLWIWHLVFGYPGAMNDLNILDCSTLFSMVQAGTWPIHKPEMNIAGRVIDWFYWVVDGIYPPYRIFLKTISKPSTKREKHFSRAQEAFRKGVERVFGVLFSRWHIIAQPSKLWYSNDMGDVVRACAILHNMIIEYRDMDMNMGTKNIVSIDPDAELVPVRTTVIPSNCYAHADYLRVHADLIKDERDHEMLQSALADKMWDRYGKQDEILSTEE